MLVTDRVQQIKDNIRSYQWCYISTKENPVDGASRGVNADQLSSDDCWFQDPSFYGRARNVGQVKMLMQGFQITIQN